MDEAIFLYTTWPDAPTAQAAGRTAVELGLAACANVLAPMTAIYRWEGAVEEATEAPMILKTSRSRAKALCEHIIAHHPYDLPCVVALPVDATASNARFLAWIEAQTGR